MAKLRPERTWIAYKRGKRELRGIHRASGVSVYRRDAKIIAIFDNYHEAHEWLVKRK